MPLKPALIPHTISATPLDLPWGKQVSKHFSEVPGFNYFYGDTTWGEIIFTGQLAEMEAELQLSFSNRYIVKAILVFGPGGITESNCLIRYKQMVKLLNVKYGHYYYREKVEDPLVEDLLYSSKCTPFIAGLRDVVTYWQIKDFKIMITLWGDDEDAFIVIEYWYTPRLKEAERQTRRKLLKKL